MDSAHYLGIDVGSSGVKTMLIRSDGRPVGVASAGYATSYPYPGHVEQNQEDWYGAACLAVREVVRTSAVPPKQVEAIALSGTSHVPSLLDKRMALLRPAILWNDIRSEAQVKRLESEVGGLIRARTGNSINCTWSLAQLVWVRENEPDVFSRVRCVLFSKDYLFYRLTGECAADNGSAVSSLMVNVESLDWDRDLLRLAGLTPRDVPRILPPDTIVAGLTSRAARDMGLPRGTIVVMGTLDSAAELIGVGATDPSIAVIRLGTAGGVMTLTSVPSWRQGCMLYPHPIEPLWYYQAGTNAATVSLQWALRLLGMSTEAGYEELDSLVAAVPSGADGLLFHPYLLGERAPYWSSRIRGGFSGATMGHGRGAFLRAVQEGVAYSLRDCAALLDWDAVNDIRLCGGGARSASWCRIIADVLGLPVVQMQLQDASAFGAALIALAGWGGVSLKEAASIVASEPIRFLPDPANREVYDDGYRRYRALADSYRRIYEETP